jgi:hypothetical protein
MQGSASSSLNDFCIRGEDNTSLYEHPKQHHLHHLRVKNALHLNLINTEELQQLLHHGERSESSSWNLMLQSGTTVVVHAKPDKNFGKLELFLNKRPIDTITICSKAQQLNAPQFVH